MLTKRLLISAVIFLLAIATSSFAGEITLRTILPEPSSSGAYVIGEIYVDLTVDAPTGGSYDEFHSVPWVAPQDGTVLITWYHPGVYITGGDSDAESDNLGFRLKLNEDSGLIVAHGLINGIGRFTGGGISYQPIIDTFIVTQGFEYDIKLTYLAEGFNDCTATLSNNDLLGIQSIIKIEYLDF